MIVAMCRLRYRVFKTTIGFKANPLGFSTVREDTEPSAGFSNWRYKKQGLEIYLLG